MRISNMRQIGIAINLYRQDWDGIDPQKGLPLSHSQLGLSYSKGLDVIQERYITDRRILFCPSFTELEPRGDWGSTYWWICGSSEQTDPSFDWEAHAARRGQDYPILLCPTHNGPVDLPPHLRASYEVLYYHVLRIDGRVDRRLVAADQPFDRRTY